MKYGSGRVNRADVAGRKKGMERIHTRVGIAHLVGELCFQPFGNGLRCIQAQQMQGVCENG